MSLTSRVRLSLLVRQLFGLRIRSDLERVYHSLVHDHVQVLLLANFLWNYSSEAEFLIVRVLRHKLLEEIEVALQVYLICL